jgi:integrase/recombinase XerD
MNLQLDWLEEYDGLFQNQEARQLLNNPLLQKDIWRTIEDLGLKINEHQKVLTIDFARIEQDWLKLLAKLYVLVRSSRKLSAMYSHSN